MPYTSDTFTHRGNEFTASLDYDSGIGRPWEEHDGHGPVRAGGRHNYHGYTSKLPGEMVLYSDRFSSWLYDYREACRIALRDGWGFAGKSRAEWLAQGLTARQVAARAAIDDFNRLRAWCNNEWHWCGLTVTLDGTEYSASLWGLESDDYAGHEEYARELADECLAQLDHSFAA